ncbi:MAG: hypothetical protein D6714_07635 [Bacteroidetes bacterium]|nr:MAG: hypothetical protein D6714_07635 [Bacteroidota bacterium]
MGFLGKNDPRQVLKVPASMAFFPVFAGIPLRWNKKSGAKATRPFFFIRTKRHPGANRFCMTLKTRVGERNRGIFLPKKKKPLTKNLARGHPKNQLLKDIYR